MTTLQDEPFPLLTFSLVLGASDNIDQTDDFVHSPYDPPNSFGTDPLALRAPTKMLIRKATAVAAAD